MTIFDFRDQEPSGKPDGFFYEVESSVVNRGVLPLKVFLSISTCVIDHGLVEASMPCLYKQQRRWDATCGHLEMTDNPAWYPDQLLLPERAQQKRRNDFQE